MIKIAGGIKISSSVGPGPESRVPVILSPGIKNKPKPVTKASPVVSGTTFTPVAAG